jgi:hypothetical protein
MFLDAGKRPAIPIMAIEFFGGCQFVDLLDI